METQNAAASFMVRGAKQSLVHELQQLLTAPRVAGGWLVITTAMRMPPHRALQQHVRPGLPLMLARRHHCPPLPITHPKSSSLATVLTAATESRAAADICTHASQPNAAS